MKKNFILILLLISMGDLYSQKTQSKKGNDSLSLKLINIYDIGKEKTNHHPLIYFSGSQWKEFIRDAVIQKGKYVPDSIVYLLKAIPLGDDPFQYGVIMFAKPCPPGCDQDIFGFCKNCPGHISFPICRLHDDGPIPHCEGSCTLKRNCRTTITYTEINCINTIIVTCECN